MEYGGLLCKFFIVALASFCLYISRDTSCITMTGHAAAVSEHPFSFAGKKAVVIAGSAGIGRGIAELIAQLGGQVVVVSSNEERVNAAVKAIGSAAQGEVVNATKEDEIKALFERVGEFDHLITSSGRGQDVPLAEATLEQLQEPWTVKYWSQLLAVKYATPHIRRGGSITLISGGNATKPGRNTTQAAAVNGAIESLGRALAGDLALQGIRVNVLSPGVVWTDLQLRWSPNDPEAQKARKESIAAQLPAGKVGEIDEVARVTIGFISSPFATGEVFHVNGGAFLV